MSEIKKDQLLLLVSKLTKSEKRFFKLFSQRHVIGESNLSNDIYLLAEQSVIEIEDRANNKKASYKKYSSLTKKNPRIKSYLLDLLLKSLRAFHSDQSSDVLISAKLHEAELLMEKSMTQLAEKKLSQANKLAEVYQKPIYILRINDMLQRIILMRDKITEKELLAIKELHDIEINALRLVEREASFRTMNVSHYMGAIRLRLNSEKVLKEWKHDWEKLQEDHNKSIPGPDFFAESYYKLSVLAKHLYISGKIDESIAVFKKIKSLFLALPKPMMEEKALTYSTSSINSLTPLMAKNKFNEIEEVIQELKSIKFKSPFRQNRHDIGNEAFELNYLINFKKLEQAHLFAKQFAEKFLAGPPEVFYQHLLVAMNASHVLFMYKEYKLCNSLLNEIIFYDKTASKNMLYNTYIFQIIVSIEQQKFDYGESKLSAYKRLIKKKKATAFEKLAYEILFQVVYQKVSITDKKFIRNSIRQIANTPLKGNHLQLTEFFDVYAWLMSKATGKGYIDCLP